MRGSTYAREVGIGALMVDWYLEASESDSTVD